MYTKKNGSAVLNSIVFLSIASIFGIAFFKFALNDRAMMTMDNFELDVYHMSKREEDVLKGFMNKINSLSKSGEGEKENTYIFSEGFFITDEENQLRYLKDEDIFILEYKNEEGSIKKRKIKYKIKDEKINFIPTYTIYG